MTVEVAGHCAGCSSCAADRPLGSAHCRRALHGDDRQPAIWLDAFRQSDRPKISLGAAAIQVAFSVFIATETWLVPVEGWFVDRFGPRVVVALGGIFVAGAWAFNAFASSLWELYVAAALSGVGAGAVYGTCVGNALKWFPGSARACRRPDRRGLRRRHRRDRNSHSRSHPWLWLRTRFSLVRSRPGPRHHLVFVASARAAAGRNAECGGTADAFASRL